MTELLKLDKRLSIVEWRIENDRTKLTNRKDSRRVTCITGGSCL